MVSFSLLLGLLSLSPAYVVAFVGRSLPTARNCLRVSPSLSTRMTATGPKPLQLPADASFEDTVLKSEVPVLVDFHAIWCAPCKLLAPVMDKLAEGYEGKLKVVKVDCDTHKDLMNFYRARGLPLMIIFDEGEVIARHEGILNFEKTEKLLLEKVPKLK